MNEDITEYARRVGIRAVVTGEPVFVIRAQDCLAAWIIEDWIHRAKDWGVAEEKLAGAVQHLQAVKVWQAEHGCKIPD